MSNLKVTSIVAALGANGDPSAVTNECVTYFSGLCSSEELAMFQFLANIGVVHSKGQQAVRNRVVTESFLEELQKLDTILGNKAFLGGETVGIDDVHTICAVLPYVNTVIEPSTREGLENINAWISRCIAMDAFNATLKTHDVHRANHSRIGRQIDLRADPKVVRSLANNTKLINESFKAKKSQRKLEKEKKAGSAATAVNTASNKTAQTKLPFCLGDKIAQDIDKASKIEKVGHKLETLSLAYESVEHEVAKDMAALLEVLKDHTGVKCKNLFLKAKKPRDSNDSRMWLVSVPDSTSVDLKALQKKLGYPAAGVLRFGDAATLLEALSCVQGDVTPFALVNDPSCSVNVILDAEMMSNPDNELWFHPLTNEASFKIKAGDLEKWIAASGRQASLVNFSNLDAPVAFTSAGSAVNGVDPAAAPTADAAGMEKLPSLESQQRLWNKLVEIGCSAPYKEDKATIDLNAKRPVGHNTHNLFLKDKKTKQRYVFTMSQDVQCDLKALAKLVGAKELRMCADRVDALCCEKGCITILSTYNNVDGSVIPVVVGDLFADPKKVLKICAGCDDPLDHSQHNVVDITVEQVRQLLGSNPKLPEIKQFDL